jgi:hypothetical protein
MTDRLRTVDELGYEVSFGDADVAEIRSGESAWSFVRVELRHDRTTVGTFTDFLYKNVDDLYRIAKALSNRDQITVVHHDDAGNNVDVLEYDPTYAKVRFEYADDSVPDDGVWIDRTELLSTLVDVLDVITVLVSGLNPRVADEIAAEEKLTEVRRLV